MKTIRFASVGLALAVLGALPALADGGKTLMCCCEEADAAMPKGRDIPKPDAKPHDAGPGGASPSMTMPKDMKPDAMPEDTGAMMAMRECMKPNTMKEPADLTTEPEKETHK